jgi:hypothetical protein
LEACKKDVNRSLFGAISVRSAGFVCLILLCDGELGLNRMRYIGREVLCRWAVGDLLPVSVRMSFRGDGSEGPSIPSVDRLAAIGYVKDS